MCVRLRINLQAQCGAVGFLSENGFLMGFDMEIDGFDGGDLSYAWIIQQFNEDSSWMLCLWQLEGLKARNRIFLTFSRRCSRLKEILIEKKKKIFHEIAEMKNFLILSLIQVQPRELSVSSTSFKTLDGSLALKATTFQLHTGYSSYAPN